MPESRSSSKSQSAAAQASADLITAGAVSPKGGAQLREGVSLQGLAAKARELRRQVIMMTAEAGSGHPGGSLSAADIVATLYFAVMRHNPKYPHWPDRDRFILSKGHAAPVLYAALAEAGYFPKDDLLNLRKLGSHLQGHTDMTTTPGVEMSAGSLGQGLSFALGTALAALLDQRQHRVYVLLGDGECDEGQVWEAAMAAAHFQVNGHPLDNLCAIVDRNDQQIDGWTHEIMNLEPFPQKWQAFGWHTILCDGHNIEQLLFAFAEAEATKGRPSVIIARTIKGKGVPFMENVLDFHGKAPTLEQRDRALRELEDEA